MVGATPAVFSGRATAMIASKSALAGGRFIPWPRWLGDLAGGVSGTSEGVKTRPYGRARNVRSARKLPYKPLPRIVCAHESMGLMVLGCGAALQH